MIVVNSVMAGFSHEMHTRLHGILSDIVLESVGLNGIYESEVVMQEIRAILGDDLAGMTTVVHIPAMLTFRVRGEWVPRHINLIGIDEETHAEVSDFDKYLLHPENRERLGFDLKEGGYDTRDRESGSKVALRTQLENVGWPSRRLRVEGERAYQRHMAAIREQQGSPADGTSDNLDPPSDTTNVPENPYETATAANDEQLFDASKEQHTGVILGIAISSVRHRTDDDQIEDYFLCLPGDDVKITFPTAGTPPQAATGSFTVVDFYESKEEPIEPFTPAAVTATEQDLRGMIDPSTGAAAVTSIQIKLRESADLMSACSLLRKRFPPQQYPYRIQTWREMQGPLLAAVRLETVILNILLFFIIAVAGFGILATFFMIVVEKTRDIGVLKALGAPGAGVMRIFLTYGLTLGAVGSGVGVILGLLFVAFINEVAAGLEWITGREVFDPTVYFFQEIPTIVNPFTVSWIVVGAVLIAVVASVMPAFRAARLHPVEALRYE